MAQPCVTSRPSPRAHIAFAVSLVPTAETEEIKFHITETVESRQSTDSISGGPDVLGCLLSALAQPGNAGDSGYPMSGSTGILYYGPVVGQI